MRGLCKSQQLQIDVFSKREGLTRITRAHRKQNLADVDTSDEAVGLAEGTTHAGLETIGSGARQHLVDADDVVGVGADAEVETFLSGGLDEVPFDTHTNQSLL